MRSRKSVNTVTEEREPVYDQVSNAQSLPISLGLMPWGNPALYSLAS